MSDAGEITRLLRASSGGDCAAGYMQAPHPDHTLQATALVHEAYLKLAGEAADRQDRSHFFAASAQQMRHIPEDEIARILGVSPDTVKRDWRFAKTWLSRELRLGD